MLGLKKHPLWVIFLLIPLLLSFRQEAPKMYVERLRCEFLENPLGLNETHPRFSWQLISSTRGTYQTAYQILVASSAEKLAQNQADLWDSGKQQSDATLNIRYQGKALKSHTQGFWKVKIWSTNGETPWSDVAHFGIGLRHYVDWKGRWIGLDHASAWDNEGQFSRLSARYFRKNVTVKKDLKQATAYIIGLGLYELYVNGQKIGNQVLAPVPTDYTQGVKYNAFDVTSSLQQGNNTLGTILGNGRFYTMRQDYKPYKIKTFGYPKMLLNLILTYKDGSRETIVTDESWKVTADGPIRSNNEYDGEEYDATKELTGWNTPQYDDSSWQKVDLVQEPGGNYEAQTTANMQIMQQIKPLQIKPLNKSFILDMGQNMAGWLKIKVRGAKGTKVTLQFAESLQADGSLYTKNLRDAQATDVYHCKGEGTEEWQPRFVYHGFRYVAITGLSYTPALEDFEGQVVYDNMRSTGYFKTASETLNQLHRNAYWGILSNYKGMPVDCPQRNERQPWLGDRCAGAYGESFLFDNQTLYAKWLDDIQQAQKADGSIPDVAPNFWRYYGDNVTWPATYFTVADMLVEQYNDKAVIEKHYASMKKWMLYMAEKYTENGIITKDKYGDWCVPPESKELIHAKDTSRITDGKLLATATYIRLLQLMQKFASIQNQASDIQYFKKEEEALKEAFNRYFLKNQHHYGNNTVTANLLPLVYNIAPSQSRQAIAESMFKQILEKNQGHISTGVIGTQWIMRGLSSLGRADIAYQLATNRAYPSWGYMLENGATTIWELWNGNTANPEMNSANHVMLLGDVMIWFYENIGGIRSESEAFKKIIFKPDFTEKLAWADVQYAATRGNIVSKWKKQQGSLAWQIELPANTTGRVFFPTNNPKNIKENGISLDQVKGIKIIGIEANQVVIEVVAGQYEFKIN